MEWLLPSKRAQRDQKAAVRAKDVPAAEAIVIVVDAVAEVVPAEVTVVAIPAAVAVGAAGGKGSPSTQYLVASKYKGRSDAAFFFAQVFAAVRTTDV